MTIPIRVLLVEDSEDDSYLMLEALRWENFEPHSQRVETALEMKTALSASEWDIVLCDYTLPRFSALAALQLLRETGSGLPLIIVSGTVSEGIAVDAMKSGAADYIMKDRLSRLGTSVGQALEQSASKKERNRIQAELIEEKTLFNGLIDTVPDQIYFKDRASRFIRINEMMARRFGLDSPVDAVGKSDSNFFSAEHALQAWTDEEAVVRTGNPIVDFEEKETWPDGRITWVSSTKVPLRDKAGNITGLVGISRDITLRKQLEEQLRQSQKMEAVGQLSGGVAHDFNNLLTVIKGYIGILRARGQVTPGMIDSIQQIDQAADRASGLTKQLLMFSRQQAMEQANYNLNGLVANFVRMLNRLLSENIELTVNLASQPLMIRADEGMIEQILLNLLINARDAMPNGGRITVTTELVVLDEAAARKFVRARAGAFVCLTIADSGTGIAPEILLRIFDPFFTTKEIGKGTGLGLATVYSIMQQHDGWIVVESQINVGTRFRAYFPQQNMVAIPLGVTKMPTEVPSGHEGILLVEDDRDVREIARAALSGLGYRIFSAANGPLALQAWQAHKPTIELLLTDLIMPDGVTGRELAVRLRDDDPHLPIVYMSGYSNELARGEFELKEGINYLCKPFDLISLAKIVRSSLDRGATVSPFDPRFDRTSNFDRPDHRVESHG